MARKKKDNVPVTLSNQELIPSIIGVIDDKEKSSWPLIFLFLFLIGFIVGLPTITNYITGEDNIIDSISENKNNDPGNVNLPTDELQFYDFNDHLVVELDGLSFQNFVVTNDKLSLMIMNNSAAKDYLVAHNLYLELYDSNRTLLQRIRLPHENLSKNTNQTYEFELNDVSDIKQIVIDEKKESDYPAVALNKNSDDEYSLVCTKGEERLVYTFDAEQKLLLIEDVVNFSSTNPLYNQLLVDYRQISSKYNVIEGVTSNLVEVGSGFTVTISLDLKKVDLSNRTVKNTLDNELYYSKDTLGKVVSFELSAMNYQCH